MQMSLDNKLIRGGLLLGVDTFLFIVSNVCLTQQTFSYKRRLQLLVPFEGPELKRVLRLLLCSTWYCTST